MNNKFIKITYIVEGHEFDLIANVNEIVRLSYGFNILEFRTPFNDGSNYLSVTQKEFDRLEKILLEVE